MGDIDCEEVLSMTFNQYLVGVSFFYKKKKCFYYIGKKI